MESLVYYPGFEPRDEEWLKFALIYLDGVTPIVPYSGDRYCSDEFRYLQDWTDLFSPLRPEQAEGNNASADCVDQVERVLKHPELYQHVLGNPRIVEEWKRPQFQVVELFDEKYSTGWMNFCLENGIGRHGDNGILIADSLANIYMTILANAIADARGLSPITDIPKLNDYGLFLRREANQDLPDERIALVKDVVELHVPDFREVSLEAAVRFRNRPGIRDKRVGFREALDAYHANAESANASGFIKDLKSTLGPLTDEVAKIAATGTVVGLGTWLVMQAGGAEEAKAFGVVAAGAKFAVDTIIGTRNAWRNTAVKRVARRYLADLSGLSNVRP